MKKTTLDGVSSMEVSLKDMKLKGENEYRGLVYFLKSDLKKKKFVIVNYWIEISPAYDGNYYSYRFEFASLNDVLAGKRGAKIKKGSFSGIGSMSAPSDYESVAYSDVVVTNRLMIKELKEVTKVIEKRGFAVK